MDLNSFPNHPYFFPYEDEEYIADPNLTLSIIVLCLFGPFWLIVSLLRGTLKKDIWPAKHIHQHK